MLICTSEGFAELAAEATDDEERQGYTAKAELAAQLERLNDALEAAFKVLTPEEFADLVWRIPNPERTDFLSHLRVPSARKPVPIAAANGLAKLRTWTTADRRRAARTITRPVLRRLMEPLDAWLTDRDDDALRKALVDDASQANAVRLMVLVFWYDLPQVVAALRLALTSGLALPTWPAEVVNDIAAACARLEVLGADAISDPGSDPETEDGADMPDSSETTVGLAASHHGPTETGAHRPDVTTAVTDADVEGGPAADTTIAELAVRLRTTVDTAHDATQQISDALAASKLPDQHLLDRIAELGTVVTHARAVLAGLGVDPDFGDDCAELAAALDRASAAQDKDCSAREQLTRLTHLSGPDTSADMLAGVRQLAQQLLDTDCWDDDQRNHVTALITLLQIIDAAEADDIAQATHLYSTAQQHLPTELGPVLVVALMGKLTARTDDTTGAHNAAAHQADPAESVDAPVPEARTTFAVAVATAPPAVSDGIAVNESPAAPDGTAGSVAPVTANGCGHDDPVSTRDNGTGAATRAEAIEPRAAADAAAQDGPGDQPSDGADLISLQPKAPSEQHRPAGALRKPDDAADDSLMASLLRRRRYCLAFHAATARGNVTRAQALRMLTLSEAVRSESGATSAMLRADLDTLHVHHFDGDRASQLALLAAAVRGALVTADPNAGTILEGLVGSLHELPHLTRVAGAIGTASARGLLSSSAILAALAPIAGADQSIATAVEAAAQARDRLRTVRFARAQQIADRWWSADGLIGQVLDIAAHDRRVDIDVAVERLRKFARREAIVEELMREDAQIRAKNSRPLEGAARRRLTDHARECLDAVGAWVDAVRANPDAARDSLQVPPQLAELRNEVRAGWVDADIELRDTAGSDDVLLAAAAAACRESVARSVELLDGTSLSGTEPDPNIVLNRELLRSPALPVDAKLNPARPVTITDIESAVAMSWAAAFDARLAIEDYGAARIIIDAVADADRLRVEEMVDRLEGSIARSQNEVRALRADVATQVEKAARLGQLSHADNSRVIAELEAANPKRTDLGAVRRQLEDIAGRLPEYASKAQEAMRSRVTIELNEAASRAANNTGPKVSDNAAELINARIDTGDLATAEEYLLNILAGEDPPSTIRSTDLEKFLAVLGAATDGVPPALIRAARDGDTHNGLDFSRLNDFERTNAVEGLEQWHRMTTERQSLRHQRTKSVLGYALRLAGIEFTNERTPYKLGNAPTRKWVELTGVKLTGGARVPAFGSRAGDLLKVMLCWGVQDAATLLTWVEQDQSSDPILVLLFGSMSADHRKVLAKECAARADRPVMVVDDAAIAFLAARGGGLFATTERILLPYAATNPYHPSGHDALPREMFFGRVDERKSILDPYGANLLYGGRQLGKSALLQAAARQFELYQDRVAVYLPLSGGFGATVKIDDLWNMIAERLAQRGITSPRKRARDAAQYVETTITAWLGSNNQRRLLLLLDECDGFFDADARTGFEHTTRLRNLMMTTNRNFKPVFAGLHQVQRFAHLPNQPLASAHFGDPIAIGPLTPAAAHDLMFTPMDTLGISFDSDELIHRVLAYCNYQPKLLQMVGEELVREALSRRGLEGPRYRIRDEDLERVIGSNAVRQKIRETVHLTLNLDSRYKLIALVVALSALERGADHAIPTNMLRDECLAWWPEGFADQGADEFRSLLSEMSGLGVLSETGGRWRLRSSNVLRLLGTAETIEEELCALEWRNVVTILSAEQARRTLTDGRISPVTEKQLATLTERSNHLWVVVGTQATGIDRVAARLTEEADMIGARFTLHVTRGPSGYRRELRGGAPGDRHRVVLSDLSTTRLDNALNELLQVDTLLPAAGVTRSLVAVVDASVSELFTKDDAPSLGEVTDRVIVLRRLSPGGLRSWVVDNEISCFGDAASQKMLLEATGGWTVLLDDAARLAATERTARRVCDAITAARLNSAEVASVFVDQVGLANNPTLAAAFDSLLDYNAPMSSEDLATWLEVTECGGARSVEALRYFDVLVERPDDGLWEPEPVFAAAWRKARQQGQAGPAAGS
ncbi:hypothetical protein [Salinispora cortesiana]|uniref:hypothetical protein n=1 Tax=Salinispora cortesiana TaxID=1305843 RepID=UPI00046F1689|nr:hypothetical protein [Salinispora cortesiana]